MTKCKYAFRSTIRGAKLEQPPVFGVLLTPLTVLCDQVSATRPLLTEFPHSEMRFFQSRPLLVYIGRVQGWSVAKDTVSSHAIPSPHAQDIHVSIMLNFSSIMVPPSGTS